MKRKLLLIHVIAVTMSPSSLRADETGGGMSLFKCDVIVQGSPIGATLRFQTTPANP